MNTSEILFQQAQKYIPGGVNSPVRAFGSVGGTPLFFKRGEGAYLIDENNNKYIDYIGSWGPLVLGHVHPAVLKAVQETIVDGMSFGAPTAREIELAQKICEIIPSIEQVRLVNSGTEATMSAIRLARGYTHRSKIIKFEGCYHGHVDSLLIKAGSGALTFNQPTSAGIPQHFVNDTLIADFNDLASVEKLFAEYPAEIAAVIIEPIAGNMNFIPPAPGFLAGLRELCTQYKTLLIFDEVMTGFRVALGGAQALYNIKPDLTTLGKIIGGGLPVGAFGGRKEIMQLLAPIGPVYQAGTLSGNPIAVSAGLATLNEISKPDFHSQLLTNTTKLMKGIQERAAATKISLITQHTCGMFGLFFTEKTAITNYKEVMECNKIKFNKFFHALLKEGIYLAPSAFEAGFVSIAHQDKEIEYTLNAMETVFNKLN